MNDIMAVFQKRRLGYFGYISRMAPVRYHIFSCVDICMVLFQLADNIQDDCTEMGTTITAAT